MFQGFLFYHFSILTGFSLPASTANIFEEQKSYKNEKIGERFFELVNEQMNDDDDVDSPSRARGCIDITRLVFFQAFLNFKDALQLFGTLYFHSLAKQWREDRKNVHFKLSSIDRKDNAEMN